jgi:hypothetical protein
MTVTGREDGDGLQSEVPAAVSARREIVGLLKVSRAVASEVDLRGLLEIIVQEAVRVTDSTAASILLNEPHGGFTLGASKGLSTGYLRFLQSSKFISFGRSM